jgi:hypothetical protein
MTLTGKNIDYLYYKKEIIHQYGYKYLFIFEKLEKFGFFNANASTLNKVFELFNYTPITNIINKLIKNKQVVINGNKSFHFNDENKKEINNTLILVIGGMTYDEIDNLSLLINKYPGKYQISTTSIISGNNIIESFI